PALSRMSRMRPRRSVLSVCDEQDYLAYSAATSEPEGLASLREGIGPRDWNHQPFLSRGPRQLGEPIGVGLSENGCHFYAAALRSGRLAQDASEDAARLQVWQERGDRLATDRIADRVEYRKCRDLRVVVDRHHMIGTKCMGSGFLPRPHAGPHRRAARLR